MRGVLNRLVRPFGYEVVRPRRKIDPDMASDEDFMRIHDTCQPFTMTSTERMYGLYQSVKYIVAEDIPGDIVECGVWMGGSAMVAAMTLDLVGDTTRNVHLYDTYEGMTPPTDQDVNFQGARSSSFKTKPNNDDDSDALWQAMCRAANM